MSDQPETAGRIAVTAVACRVPGAASPEALWRNLCDGVEARTELSDEELLAAGVPEERLADEGLVKAGFLLDDVELFDPHFFGFSPREAEILDPQHRLFLECAWETLERCGAIADTGDRVISLFAGVGLNSYFLYHLKSRPDVLGTVGSFQALIGNEKDFLPSRVSHRLGLTGPSVSVQCACSSSLVAVHLACQSLLSGESDLALAGGVSINLPMKMGHYHEPGGIASVDGHCRAFDRDASGTTGGSGLGIVALKLLDHALEDGDPIHAVILGTAVNNDGAAKVGYTAPSIEGQAGVITEALSVAGIDADTIGYVEAHGTGTPLGDPIEVTALHQAFAAFGADTPKSCALGSIKTNLGHLDTAAGVAGLIKAVLAVEHGEIPPSLHFEAPNPEIDFNAGPFYVNARHVPWPAGPRRAGVSSFGIGGTNAHVIVEEPPATRDAESRDTESWHVLRLSARSPEARDRQAEELARHLEAHPEVALADVAHTLDVGRRRFRHRRAVVVRGGAGDAAAALGDAARWIDGDAGESAPAVTFLFPGQGAQYVGMGRRSYERWPHFRDAFDRCCAGFEPHLGLDLRRLVFADPGDADAADALRQTVHTQPALFAVEYALARHWMEHGAEPAAMIGHSLGEYVAACLAGVFELDDALALVAERARRMQELPPGSMLSVALAADRVEGYLGAELSLAASNAPELSVVSGETAAVDALAERLSADGVEHRRLRTSHAFHSPMVEPVLEPFRRKVAAVALQPPRIPYVSNRTGGWITAAEATDPDYWVDHLRHGVRMAEGLATLLADPERLYLEVGPGRTMASLVRRNAGDRRPRVVGSLPPPKEAEAVEVPLLRAASRLWAVGVELDGAALADPEDRARGARIVLPTYPFERHRCWVEMGSLAAPAAATGGPPRRHRTVAETFYLPHWQPAPRLAPPPELGGERIALLELVGDDGPLAELAAALAAALGDRGAEVERGEPGSPLDAAGPRIDRLIALGPAADRPVDPAYGPLLALLETVDRLAPRLAPEARLVTVTRGLFEDVADVADDNGGAGDAGAAPEAAAALLAPVRTLPAELGLETLHLDLDPRTTGADQASAVVAELAPATAPPAPRPGVVRWHGGRRLVEAYAPAPLDDPGDATLLRPGGSYLVTGGLGKIGLLLAETLAGRCGARLALLGRSGLVPRERWDAHCDEHPEEDPTRRRIEALRAIEAAGGEVLVLQADVADEAAMADALAAVDDRFGALHGVIHGAGSLGAHALATAGDTGAELLADQFRAKVAGTRVLARLLAGRELDFVMLHSSIATVLGVRGFTAYTAANCALEALGAVADRGSRGTTPWIRVAWDGWLDGDRQGGDQQGGDREPASTTLGLTPAQGRAAFLRLLATPRERRWVVSTADLATRRSAVARPEPADEDVASAEEHRRPTDLSTAYAEPRDEVERGLVEIWRDLLGIDRIGIHDDFFELGGHSLLATRLSSRIRARFGLENLSIDTLFSSPTVAEQAVAVVEESATGVDAEELERLLAELEDE